MYAGGVLSNQENAIKYITGKRIKKKKNTKKSSVANLVAEHL